MIRSDLSNLGRRSTDPPISWLMHLALERPRLISLAAGFTDNDSLPAAEARELFDELLSQRQGALSALQYGPTAGNRELRWLAAARLSAQDGRSGSRLPAYPPERFLITNGSQQLLYMVTEALCDPGDIVLVEDPTYFVYLGIAQSHAIRCRGVRLDDQGLLPEHLEEVLAGLHRRGELARVKMLFWVSYFQNPTGITAALDRKRAVGEILLSFEKRAGHPIYLLEDAAYRELRFSGEEVPSALAIKGADRVIYAGTFTKPFATGIRIGYGYLPESLFAVVHRIKGDHDFGSSNLLQSVLARALSSGRYERHLPALQSRYARKAKTMLKALEAHFPEGVDWRAPEGGLYCWARLPVRVKTGPRSELFQAALARNVLYVPGGICYADDPARRKPQHEMRLSFGGARQAEIQTGIARLGREVGKVLNR